MQSQKSSFERIRILPLMAQIYAHKNWGQDERLWNVGHTSDVVELAYFKIRFIAFNKAHFYSIFQADVFNKEC